jgi:hypothetical protein
LGVHDHSGNGSADSGDGITVRGGIVTVIGDGGSNGEFRLCGECIFQQRFGVHDHGWNGSADGGGRVAVRGGDVSLVGDGGSNGEFRLCGE